ncbi:unnamed protein product [Hyaloperonospora brassicae]|uniref:TatD related DNase n=1 Tax=Hyaloperonospora brassicae TaxID=162125 RepID=A0AAV0T4U8_HYABA|nr:unnamed protein product [Hyaloperonospora brassicae]
MTIRRLIDAHCHLHDDRLGSPSSPSSRQRLKGVLARARVAHLSHVVSCATHEHDWHVLQQLMEQQRAMSDRSLVIVPAFGLHPWWALDLTSRTTDTLASLRDMLTLYPSASVGEIGLCKSARGQTVPLDVQVKVFQAQLQLAVELERTCVVHCVGYYGKLLEVLLGATPQLPPVLVLHSYSGSPDMMRSFLALRNTRVFISLNAKQLTDPRMKKAATCCKESPLGALLLETDAPDQAPSVEIVEQAFTQADEGPLVLQEGSAGVNEPALVKLALQGAAKIRGVTLDEVAAAVYRNCMDAFGLDEAKAQ